MKKISSYLPLILFTLLLIYGCTNERTGNPVSFSEMLFGINENISQFQDSETYELMPGEVKGIIAIISIGISSLANVLLSLQNQKQKKTLTEIILTNPDLQTKTTETEIKIAKTRKMLSLQK